MIPTREGAPKSLAFVRGGARQAETSPHVRLVHIDANVSAVDFDIDNARKLQVRALGYPGTRVLGYPSTRLAARPTRAATPLH